MATWCRRRPSSRGCASLCDQHGILLIVDEVQTGMGRTGKWWAIEHTGVEPDMVCTAKGIASGVPLGGFLAKRSLATWPVGAHGNTYGGNPIAAVAALATMDVLENGGIENAATQGAYMMARLDEMATRDPSMGDVRGVGLMVGVELVTGAAADPCAPDAELAKRVLAGALERGLIALSAGSWARRSDVAPRW